MDLQFIQPVLSHKAQGVPDRYLTAEATLGLMRDGIEAISGVLLSYPGIQ